MSGIGSQKEPTMDDVKLQQTAAGDYVVGKCRPPMHSRWKPGQSGNPKGRPKGSRNLKTELKEIASKTVTIRDGGKEEKLSMFAANALAHGVKGAKGDARSASLFLNFTHKAGVLEDDHTQVGNAQKANSTTAAAAVTSSLSDMLFAHLDLGLLAREDMAELSRLAELVDLNGFAGFSTADFSSFKSITDKGRSKNITLQ